jgi:anti-sigma B factor antagonist
MTIEQRSVGTVVVLDLNGKLVSGESSGLLKDKVHSLMFQGKKQLVLNLGGVGYMDSSGLGELIATHTTAARQGGKVKIANLTQRVSDLMTIAKVLSVFDTYDSEADALAAFPAQA